MDAKGIDVNNNKISIKFEEEMISPNFPSIEISENDIRKPEERPRMPKKKKRNCLNDLLFKVEAKKRLKEPHKIETMWPKNDETSQPNKNKTRNAYKIETREPNKNETKDTHQNETKNTHKNETQERHKNEIKESQKFETIEPEKPLQKSPKYKIKTEENVDPSNEHYDAKSYYYTALSSNTVIKKADSFVEIRPKADLRSIQTIERHMNLTNAQVQRRLVANARERSRVHALSNAFELLRTAIPSYSKDQKLSKLTILRVAINYISALQEVLASDQPPSSARFAGFVNECNCILQNEYGRPKR